jgi:hypothetical protein
MSASRVVHCWEKNSAGEEIHASVSTFKGRRYVDLRVYFSGEDSEAHPTGKGVTVAAKQLSELAEAGEVGRRLRRGEPWELRRARSSRCSGGGGLLGAPGAPAVPAPGADVREDGLDHLPPRDEGGRRR